MPKESASAWAARLNDAGVAAALTGDQLRAIASFTRALEAKRYLVRTGGQQSGGIEPSVNLASSAPTWLYAIVLACLAAGAIEDVLRRRISNITCILIVVLAVVAALVTGPTWGLWQNFAASITLLAAGTFAFANGWVGGGDVKFLSAIALWLPVKAAVAMLVVVFLAGGLLAIVAMIFWHARKTQKGSSKSRQIAYGLAIAAGSAFVFQSLRLQ